MGMRAVWWHTHAHLHMTIFLRVYVDVVNVMVWYELGFIHESYIHVPTPDHTFFLVVACMYCA